MVALPAPTACGCAATPALVASDAAPSFDPHGSAAPPWLVARRGRVVLDTDALACVIDAMPATVASLASYFTLKSRFLLGVLAAFDNLWYVACDDDCTFPARPVPVLVGCVALFAGGGMWQPQIQVRWDFCCRNWCLIFWWETFISSVMVRVNAGGPVNTRAQAIAAARQRAAAVIARLAPPAAPC